MTCDQARAPTVGNILPEPVHCDKQRASYTNQKVNVCYAPDPPGEETRQSHERQLDNGRFSADSRKIAGMTIVK